MITARSSGRTSSPGDLLLRPARKRLHFKAFGNWKARLRQREIKSLGRGSKSAGSVSRICGTPAPIWICFASPVHMVRVTSTTDSESLIWRTTSSGSMTGGTKTAVIPAFIVP